MKDAFWLDEAYKNSIGHNDTGVIQRILNNHGIRAYHIFVNQSVNVYPKSPYLKEYYDI